MCEALLPLRLVLVDLSLDIDHVFFSSAPKRNATKGGIDAIATTRACAQVSPHMLIPAGKHASEETQRKGGPRMHKHSQACTSIHTDMHASERAKTYTCTCMQALTQACARIRKHAHACTRTLARIRLYARVHLFAVEPASRSRCSHLRVKHLPASEFKKCTRHIHTTFMVAFEYFSLDLLVCQELCFSYALCIRF